MSEPTPSPTFTSVRGLRCDPCRALCYVRAEHSVFTCPECGAQKSFRGVVVSPEGTVFTSPGPNPYVKL